jgi:hypothetical protein
VKAIQECAPATPSLFEGRRAHLEDRPLPSRADEIDPHTTAAKGDVLQSTVARQLAIGPPGGGAASAVLRIL